jgi:hypothetical protein
MPMSELRLIYEPEDGWHGQLHAFAEADGYAARGTAWFTRDALIGFSRALTQYPLPSHAPVAISGGVGAMAADRPEHVHVGLSITPAGVRGMLLVCVELASDSTVEVDADVQQHALLCFPTEYAELDRFQTALGAMLDHGGETLLRGRRGNRVRW